MLPVTCIAGTYIYLLKMAVVTPDVATVCHYEQQVQRSSLVLKIKFNFQKPGKDSLHDLLSLIQQDSLLWVNADHHID